MFFSAFDATSPTTKKEGSLAALPWLNLRIYERVKRFDQENSSHRLLRKHLLTQSCAEGKQSDTQDRQSRRFGDGLQGGG